MPSGSDFVKLQGYSSLLDGFDDLLDEWNTDQTVIVGTPAEYAINRIVASV